MLDEHAGERLNRHVDTVLPTAPAPRLVVDLTEITSVTPVGLTTLLTAQSRLEGRGGRLLLHEPSADVVRLLHEALLDGS